MIRTAKRFLPLIVLLLLFSCGSGTDTVATGSITATAEWPHDNNTLSVDLREVKTIAPVGVVTVRMIVSGSGMTSMQSDFNASAGYGKINNIPVGTNRTLTFEGLDSSGSVIYQGSVPGITVNSNQTTDVGTVSMVSIVPDSIVGDWYLFDATGGHSGDWEIDLIINTNTISWDDWDAMCDSYGNYYISGNSIIWSISSTSCSNGLHGHYVGAELDIEYSSLSDTVLLLDDGFHVYEFHKYIDIIVF